MERDAKEALTPQDTDVCDALVHRLRLELAHSDIHGDVGSLRLRKIHPMGTAAGKLIKKVVLVPIFSQEFLFARRCLCTIT